MNTTGFNRWLFRKGQPPVQYLDTLLADIPGAVGEQSMVASIRPDGGVVWYHRRSYGWVPQSFDDPMPNEYLIQLLLIK